LVQSGGHNAPGLIDELVPCLAAMVDEIVIGVEDTVREPVIAHELPDVLDRVELGTFRRQGDDSDVCAAQRGASIGASQPEKACRGRKWLGCPPAIVRTRCNSLRLRRGMRKVQCRMLRRRSRSAKRTTTGTVVARLPPDHRETTSEIIADFGTERSVICAPRLCLRQRTSS
jgi:hypothetical protein